MVLRGCSRDRSSSGEVLIGMERACRRSLVSSSVLYACEPAHGSEKLRFPACAADSRRTLSWRNGRLGIHHTRQIRREGTVERSGYEESLGNDTVVDPTERQRKETRWGKLEHDSRRVTRMPILQIDVKQPLIIAALHTWWWRGDSKTWIDSNKRQCLRE